MKCLVEMMSDIEKRNIIELNETLRLTVLPAAWRIADKYPNATAYESRKGLLVFVEVELQKERSTVHRRHWIHLSVSRRDRLPDYAELSQVKDLFIGPERKAIQVFPSKAEHYNLHPRCLHLWAPLDVDPLPDFRAPNGAI